MKEHNEFDDYIKGFFNEEHEVPAELRWEFMDIELPNTTTPNKSTNRKLWGLLILLFLFIVIPIIFLSIRKQKVSTLKDPTKVVEQIVDEALRSGTNNFKANQKKQAISTDKERQYETIASKIEQPENEAITSNAKTNKIDRKNQVVDISTKQNGESSLIKYNQMLNKAADLNSENLKRDEINPIITMPRKHNKTNALIVNEPVNKSILSNSIKSKLNEKNQDKFDLNYTLQKTNVQKNFIENSNSKRKDDFDNSTENIDTKAEHNATGSSVSKINSKSTQESTTRIIEILPIISMNNLPHLFSKSIELKERQTSFEKDSFDKKSKVAEIVIAFGYNNFNLKIEDTNILKDKISKVRDWSYKAGIKFRLNTNWKTNLYFKYDRYHTKFEHSRDLTPIYDYENFLKIKRKEVTIHNNFTKTLGLQLGLERTLFTINQLQLYTGIGVTPTYTLSTDGKTTGGILVDTLVYNSEVGKLSVQGGLNIGVVYTINASILVEATYQFNQFFGNEIFINNKIQTSKQSVMSLGLIYRL